MFDGKRCTGGRCSARTAREGVRGGEVLSRRRRQLAASVAEFRDRPGRPPAIDGVEVVHDLTGVGGNLSDSTSAHRPQGSGSGDNQPAVAWRCASRANAAIWRQSATAPLLRGQRGDGVRGSATAFRAPSAILSRRRATPQNRFREWSTSRPTVAVCPVRPRAAARSWTQSLGPRITRRSGQLPLAPKI